MIIVTQPYLKITLKNNTDEVIYVNDVIAENLSEEFIATESAKLPLMPKDYREKFGEIIPHDTLEILLDYPQLMHKIDETAELLTGPRPSGPSPRADGAISRAAALRNTPDSDNCSIKL